METLDCLQKENDLGGVTCIGPWPGLRRFQAMCMSDQFIAYFRKPMPKTEIPQII
jgi:hypothetical protein